MFTFEYNLLQTCAMIIVYLNKLVNRSHISLKIILKNFKSIKWPNKRQFPLDKLYVEKISNGINFRAEFRWLFLFYIGFFS